MNSIALVDSNFRAQYRDRWYSPEQGQFLSEDPIGFEGDDFNLYRYVRNQVLTLTDPYGKNPCLTSIPKAIACGVAIGIAFSIRSCNQQKKSEGEGVGSSGGSGGGGSAPNACPRKPSEKQKKRCKNYPSSPGCRQFSNCEGF